MTEFADKLGGLHAVVALTQDSINFQLSQLHKRGVIKPQLQLDTGSGLEIDAVLAPPTLTFSVPKDRHSAILTLPLASGKLTRWEGYGPKATPHTVPIADWRLAFRVNLNFQEIAAEHVRASAAIPGEVREHLEKFSPDMFSIRRLLCDFENAQLLELDADRTRLPVPGGASAGVIADVQSLLRTYLMALGKTDNPFVLGYAVDVRPAKPVEGPLAATSGTFATLVDPRDDGMNALNFLLMTNHEPLPTAPSTGLFERNWARSKTLDGRLVIAASRFWSSGLLAQLQPTLGDATRTEDGWTMEKATKTGGPPAIKGLSTFMGFPLDVVVTNTTLNKSTVTCRNASETSVAVHIAGTFSSRRQYEAWPMAIYEMFAEIATVRWRLDLTYTAGANGRIDIASKLELDPAEYSTDYNWAGWGDSKTTRNRELLEKDGNQLETRMNELLKHLKTVQIAPHVVAPTSTTMFLKNVQVDEQRNVLLDIAFNSAK